tara:strand:+ start:348 stop:506 length:159 start_codon:yes stop_codon:yes gene_type:complete
MTDTYTLEEMKYYHIIPILKFEKRAKIGSLCNYKPDLSRSGRFLFGDINAKY